MKILFLLFFFLAQGFLFAQTIYVFDKSTLVPIEGVVVSAGENQVITNEKGQANISELDTNKIWITNHIVYLPEEISYSELRYAKFKLGLTVRIFPLNEIVISAKKFSERKSTVAYETLIMREQEIQRLLPSSPADLLEKSGQVFVQKSQSGGGSPILRGFEANKILLMLDGVRLNNAIFRSGHLHNIANQDEQILARTEVIYGSGPVVYGSDALGGVISLYTEDPQLSDSADFIMNYKGAARYATANEGQAYHLGFNIAGKKFASLTSGSVSDYGDLKQGSIRNSKYPNFGKRFWHVERMELNDTIADVIIPNDDPDIQVPSSFIQNNFLQKFLFKQSDYISHLMNIQINETSPQSFYARLTQTDEEGLPVWAEWNYGRQSHLFLSYRFELISGNKFFDETKLIAAFQRYRESRQTRRFNSEWQAYRAEEVLIFSINNDYLKRLSSRHEISYGIEYWSNEVNSNAYRLNILDVEFEDLDTRYPDGGSNMWSGAAYLLHSWNYKPSVIIHSGMRITTTSLNSKFIDKSFFNFPFNEISQQNTSLSGSVGAVINPNRNLKLSLSASTAFRTPNVDDIAKVFDTSPGLVVVPNPDLGSERTYTFEAGAVHTHQNILRTSLTGWYTIYNNIITLQPAFFNGQDSILFNGMPAKVVQQQNADNAFLYGARVSVEADPGQSFSVYSFLTYTYGRINTDTTTYPLDHIPPLYGKAGIAWKGNKLRIDSYSIFNVAKKLKDYNLFGEDNFAFATADGMPAWYTINFSLTYQPLKQVSLKVAAENILDQNYRTFASGISAPGKNFIFAMRFYF
jgi:hemoglobin/transferrin/lactoferrin receptor protein